MEQKYLIRQHLWSKLVTTNASGKWKEVCSLLATARQL